MPWRERDSPQHNRISPFPDRAELNRTNRDPEHLRDLSLRKRGAEAAADATAERQP
jgi:hypothetical protein